MSVTSAMAFFGLTQVGPQNQFQSALLDAMDITLFSDDEFIAAFRKLDKDRSGFIELGEASFAVLGAAWRPPRSASPRSRAMWL